MMHWSPLLRSTPLVIVLIGPLVARAQPPRLEFTRMVAHWDGYNDPDYLAFIDEARPEVVQVGFYGAHFWSLAPTPFGGGYPAHFPVRGLDECGDWFEDLNEQLHRRGAKVVGHFNVEFLVGDPDSPEGPRGFFKFYRDLWDEKELGPRPTDDPLDLLQKGPDGKPIVQDSYKIGGMREYWGCLNNPKWRDVLKAWVRRASGGGSMATSATTSIATTASAITASRASRATLPTGSMRTSCGSDLGSTTSSIVSSARSSAGTTRRSRRPCGGRCCDSRRSRSSGPSTRCSGSSAGRSSPT